MWIFEIYFCVFIYQKIMDALGIQSIMRATNKPILIPRQDHYSLAETETINSLITRTIIQMKMWIMQEIVNSLAHMLDWHIRVHVVWEALSVYTRMMLKFIGVPTIVYSLYISEMTRLPKEHAALSFPNSQA